MPRMREAMRSGWKYSSWSSFSPIEASLIGLPVTALTESAAPPRASPSSFVRTTPSKATRSWNASATETASWPVIASRTSSTFVGFAASRTAASSSISASSTWSRPAVSRMTTSRPWLRACSIPCVTACDRVGALVVDRDLRARGRAARAGRSRPGAGGRRRRARALAPPCAGAARASRRRSSCPSPAGPRAGSPSAAGRRTRACESPVPISAVSSSWTIFTTCWPGVRLFVTSAPSARSRTRATKSFTTLKLTSASSSARRISRIAREIASSSSVPRPRRSPSAAWSRSESVSNTAGQCTQSLSASLTGGGSRPAKPGSATASRR